MNNLFTEHSISLEVARRGLPKIGEQVWCSAPQKEEHLAKIMEYRHNFTEVLVKWDWSTGKQWEQGTWVDINSLRTKKSDDTYNLWELLRINYSE